MTWNTGLSGKALSIAGINAKYLRVMAGPGTGKTFAMKRRLARLLEQNVDPKRILAVTFTRVAAATLVKELKELNIAGCEKIQAGTLHAFCFRILNRREVFEFSGRVPRPLVTFSKSGVLQFEAAPMLEDIRMEGKREDTKRIRAFDAAWARLQTEEPGWPLEAEDRLFHDSLIAWLVFHRAILIGELVPQVLKYLKGNPQCPDLTAFDHVIADEYQDLNRADQVLLDNLSSGNAVVIGDENQSIYRFRYAHPQGINEYAAGHPDTIDHDLDECRRCPTLVVELANQLILNNHPGSSTPKLKPLAGNPAGRVHIVQWQSMEEEGRETAAYIKALLAQGNYKPRDILVLTPRRMIAYKIRDELSSQQVSVHSFYHEEALEEESAQLVFVLLNLLAEPEDRVALRYWLGHGSPSWRTGEYAKLRAYCEQTGLSPNEALKRHSSGELSIPGTAKLLQRFKELQKELAQLADLKGSSLVDRVMPPDRKELKILRESVLPMVEEDTSAREIIERVRAAVTQPEMPEEGDFVRIMSLQKSKGLTSQVVIVTGCIEGFIPVHPKDVPDAEAAEILKEQRRLFYVAITRASEVLVVSSFAEIPRQLAYKTGAAVHGWSDTVASRFVQELGPAAPAASTGAAWKGRGYE